MSTNDKFLSFDVTILLARYGEKSVIGELSKQVNLREDELEDKLARIRSLPKRESKSKKAAPEFSLELYMSERPDIAEQMKVLDSRYDNRTFLSELRHVKRFLERRGVPSANIKSRELGKRKVFELITSLSGKEVSVLMSEDAVAGESSLGIISDQILRHRKNAKSA